MARASYIYLVTDDLTDLPLSAFTVKYEMIGWLKRHKHGPVTVRRIPDGWDRANRHIYIYGEKELLNE
jgi:hypothetical protein